MNQEKKKQQLTEIDYFRNGFILKNVIHREL